MQTQTLKSDISKLSQETDVQTLLDELDRCVEVTLNSVRTMAGCVIRLEELGVDLSNRSSALTAMLPTLRRIGDGSALAEVSVQFQGLPQLRNKVSLLPLTEQRRIVRGECLRLMLPGGDHLMVNPLNLGREQVLQIFAADHIRNDSEQIAWLANRNALKRPKPERTEPERRVDRKNNGVWIGAAFVSASDLASYLSQLTNR